jgi:hypothetical protein
MVMHLHCPVNLNISTSQQHSETASTMRTAVQVWNTDLNWGQQTHVTHGNGVVARVALARERQRQ